MPPSPVDSLVGTVVLTLTVSGSVSDYSDTSNLQQSVANVAGVDTSLVTISLAAASVIITATIAVPASTTPAALQTSLSSKLATAATASAALGVTVEAVPTVTTASPAGTKDDLSQEEGETGLRLAAVGGLVGGSGALLLLAAAVSAVLCRRRRARMLQQRRHSMHDVELDQKEKGGAIFGHL